MGAFRFREIRVKRLYLVCWLAANPLLRVACNLLS